MKKYILFFSIIFLPIIHAATFFDLIDQGKERDPRLDSAEALRDAQASAVTAGRLNFLPTLSAGGTLSDSSLSNYETTTKGLSAQLNLFNGSRDWRALQASKYNLTLREQRKSLAGLTVELEVAQAIFDYLKLSKQIELQKKVIAAGRQNLEITQIRFSQGRIPEVDLLKARVELENRSEDLTNLENSLAQAKYAVERWQLLSQLSAPTDWPWSKLDLSTFEKIVAQKNQHESLPPQLATIEQESLAARESARARWGNFLPTLDVTVARNEIETGLSTRYWESTVLFTLKIPLFDGWADVAGLREQNAQALALEYDLRFSSIKLSADQKSLHQGIVLGIAALERRRATTLTAQKLYQQSLKRYSAGLTSYADLTLDLDRWLRSEFLLIQGHAQVSDQIARWCNTQGALLRNCL